MANKAAQPKPGRLVRAKKLVEYTSLSRATLYRLIKKGEFPSPIKLTANTTVWDLEEVDAWIASRRKAQGGAA